MDNYQKNILNFSKQLSLKALRFYNLSSLKKAKRPSVIIVIGMGGSGAVANLLQNLSGYVNINVPVIPWKDYGLPRTVPTCPVARQGRWCGKALVRGLPVYKNPFYLFVSFSGDTQETISGLLKAKSYQLKAIVSGGGKLTSLARRRKLALATFEKGTLAPRQANGLMFYGALGVIKKLLPETRVPDLSQKINPTAYQKIGRAIAKKIKGKTVLIYTSNQNSHLGYLWKIHLNEAGKALAFNNVLPEMNHNEIVSFETKPKNTAVIFLKDRGDSPKIQKRFKVTDQILKKFNIPTINLEIKGAPLEKTFNSLALAEWTSYYLAKLKNIDPEETKIIDEIKKII